MTSLHSKKLSVGTELSLSKVLSSQNPNSYANGLSAKAQNAMRSVITGSDQTSPYRQTAKNRPAVQVKIPSKQHSTMESKDYTIEASATGQDRGFKPTFDLRKSSCFNGSPLNSPTGLREHRGYSLLNQPVQINESDDSQGEASVTIQRQKSVTAVKLLNSLLSYNKDKTKPVQFPDLLFQGFGIQPNEPMTVELKKMRRLRRNKERATHRMNGKNQGNFAKELSSQHMTSITDEKMTSVKLHAEINQSAIESLANHTQSPRLEHNQNLGQIQEATISSGFTKDHLNNTTIRNQINGWLPFQTQSISIPQHTIEALGEKTFRSNAELAVHVSANADSVESVDKLNSARNQILAQSSINSKPITKKQTPAQTSVQKSNVAKNSTNAKANQKLTINKITSKTSTNKAQPQISPRRTPRVTAQQASKQLTKKSPAPNQDKQAAKKVQASGRGTPLTQRDKNVSRIKKSTELAPTKANDRTPSRANRKSNVSKQGQRLNQKSNENPSVKDARMFKMKSSDNDRQNSSQDQILINEKHQNRSTSKQQPPIQPGIKRFKTQTRESQNSATMADPPQLVNKVKLEEGFDTSSFNEDLSVTQKHENANDSTKKARLPPQLVLNLQTSGNDELGKVSDPYLKELSIVESEHSNHVDTPGLALGRPIGSGSFNDLAGNQTKEKNQKSKTALHSQVDEEDCTPMDHEIDTYQKQILIMETDGTPPGSKSKPDPNQNIDIDKLRFKALNVKQTTNYMSSNDSAILAASRMTSPINTVSETIASNGNTCQRKNSLRNKNLKTQPEESYLRVKKEGSDMSVVKRESLNVPSSGPFAGQRLSNHAMWTYKRSSTREMEKLQNLIKQSSTRKVGKNMPLQSNCRAKNQVKQKSQFVDSDFYDSHSVQRVKNRKGSAQKHRMGSTSPVSSRASGFLRQASIRTRKSQGSQQKKKDSREVQASDSPPIKDFNEREHSYSPLKKLTRLDNLNREYTKAQKKTDQFLQQNQKRVLGRMYQKKFIERREKQAQILNNQLTGHSDSEMQALAYAVATQYDSNPSMQTNQVKRLKHQDPLTSLRRVQDSLKIDKQIDLKSNMSKIHKQRSEFGQKTRMHTKRTEISANTSVDKPFSKDALLGVSGQVNLQNSIESLAQKYNQPFEDRRRYQQSVTNNTQPRDQGENDPMQADNERGGPKLVSDDSSLQKTFTDYNQDEQQASRIESPELHLNGPNKNQTQNSAKINGMKQFQVPKVRAPQNYQTVVERKYNMVQVEDETYFIPSRASQSVYATKPQQKGSQKSRMQRLIDVSQIHAQTTPDEQPTCETTKSPRTNSGLALHAPNKESNFAAISNRKKSHELTSIRNKYNTDEGRLNKLANFTVGKEIARNRQLQVSGRDDPSNLLGYQKLEKNYPQTMRQGAHSRKKTRRDPASQANGLVDLSNTGADDKMTHTIQKNIYGMLNDLNRAKNMRIANQVLKDQQQQMLVLQQRREQICSQGQDQNSNRKLMSMGHSAFNRQNKGQNQTMPTIPALASNTSIISANEKSMTSRQMVFNNQEQTGQRRWPSPLKQFNQHHESMNSSSAVTPLANTGLRIIQTNNTYM